MDKETKDKLVKAAKKKSRSLPIMVMESDWYDYNAGARYLLVIIGGDPGNLIAGRHCLAALWTVHYGFAPSQRFAARPSTSPKCSQRHSKGVFRAQQATERHPVNPELLATAEALGLPVLPGLHLRQVYADAVGQGTVVWRMPNARAASDEIYQLFKAINQCHDEA